MKTFVVLSILTVLCCASPSALAQQDSFQIKSRHLFDSLSHASDLTFSSDSLNILSWADSVKQKVRFKFNRDSLGYQNKIDSLNQLGLPGGQYSYKLDSIMQKRDALMHEIDNKQQQALTTTKNKIEDWKEKVKQKLGIDKVQQNTGQLNGDLPGNVPANGMAIPTDGMPALNPDMAALGLPEMPTLGNTSTPDLNLSPDLSAINESVSIKELDQLKDIQGNIGDVGGKISEVSAMTKDPNKIVDTGSEKLLQKAGVHDELKGVETIKDNEFLERADQLKDPDALKEEVKEQAVQKAVNHFAGKEQVLQQAMETLSKYKLQYESLNSLGDLKKRPPNPMKGKPFIERLLPGVALQILKQQNTLMLDINPYVGYRLSGSFISGLGWNQRIGYHTKDNYFTSASVVYGPRVFTEAKVWKGFSVRAEAECLHTFVPPLTQNRTVDNGNYEWVWSYMIGIKKEYAFIRNVRGTVFVMFNLYDPKHKSPYGDILNSRFGFEFPLKKRAKEQRPEGE